MGTFHELRSRKRQSADLFDAVRFDPLGEGERMVAISRAPAPRGWRLSALRDLPCYVNGDLDAVVTIMSSVDDHMHIWDHAFIALPAPIDRKALLDCVAT